jgi:formylglycine-generating enzyme required for sulfatase activity
MDCGTNNKIVQSMIDGLDPFLDDLRMSGYKIGMDTSLKIHVLLIRLAERDSFPNNPDELYVYLAPLICTSEKEQTDFKIRFDNWVHTFTSPKQTISPVVRKNRLYAVVLLSVFMMLVLFGLWWTFFYEEQTEQVSQNTGALQTQGQVSAKKDRTSPFERVTSVTINEQFTPNPIERWQVHIWPYVPMIVMLLFMIAAWFIFWWWRAKQFISRMPSRAEVTEKHLYLESSHLFQSLIMVRTARKFRRYMQHPSDRLDADATVAETCRNAGYFTPVYGMIHRLPQYLVLIDRTIYDDHQARWMDAFLDRLIANDVYVKRFYFSGTPHVFYPQLQSTNASDNKKASVPQAVSLETLSARYSNYRLIVFTDAEFFVHTFSGKLAHWIKKFDQWPVRALLLPGTEKEIHFRRQALAQTDFIVMPASEKGLSALVEKFQHLAPQTNVSDLDDPTYPGILHRYSGQWLDRNAPPEGTIEQLIAALKTYLDSPAMEWLAACAIFPSLNHSLTAYLGETLDVLTESRLLKLSRLPWFRFNTIPDWLRKHLLVFLSTEKEQKIREAITKKLEQSIHESQKDHPLTFSTPQFGFAKRWYRSVLNALRGAASPDNPLQDRIFFNFMYQRLSFRLSKKLYQILGPKWTIRRLAGQAFTLIIFGVILLGSVYFLTKEPAPKHSNQFSNSLGMTFVHIPSGTFEMGSPEDEKGRISIRETLHKVTLTQDFFMQTTEVTQGQWKAVMGENPSYFKNCGNNCPVEQVSWNDVQAFIKRLNAISKGQQYRLPTEAEWEYAARAGSKTAFANGDIQEKLCDHDPNLDKMGWYCGNSKGKTHPVAQKQPNQWQLFDMHGNVWEWCSDYFDEYPSEHVTDPMGPVKGASRVVRGGSWVNDAGDCRSAIRSRVAPDDRGGYLGFRLVAP